MYRRIIAIMVHLSETQRIEILILLGCGDKTRSQDEVRTLFNAKYPNQHISQSTISKIAKKFRETGSVKNIQNGGRPKINDNTKLDILLAVEDNPYGSTRQIAAQNGICQQSVVNILHGEKYHPYKVHFSQELSERDYDRRLEFCEVMQDKCNENPEFPRNIVFSDESTFCLNGTVNRQNWRCWSRENPRWMREEHTQYPQKVNVWAGIINNTIIGPFFLPGILTGDSYLEFLRNEVMPDLIQRFPNQNNPHLLDDNIWFQQDGAPPHFSARVRDFLNDMFGDQWIGRGGPIDWPPRSPDLTPLDFFLWGYLKDKIYVNKPPDVETLKNRIRTEIRRITPEIISNVINETVKRFGYCQEVNGGHYEYLIK